MKRGRIRGLLAAVLLTSSLWGGTSAYAASEIRVDGNQPAVSSAGIDISYDYAVWILQGENTITLYDIYDSRETKIGNKSSKKTEPKVDGEYIAWIDDRHGGADVYVYDIRKDRETRITSGRTEATQLELAEDKIVWVDERDGNVYLYDLKTGDEKQVSKSGKASNPTVSRSYVAWEDKRNKNSDIYYYDISREREYQATSKSANEGKPSLYDDQIIYEYDKGSDTDIHLYEIGRDRDDQLTDSSDDELMPHMNEDYFIYVEGNNLILGDVTRPSRASVIEKGIHSRIQPRIAGDFVLFVKRDRDDNLTLHMYDTEDEELVPIGGMGGEPSQPHGDDRYVVYINESGKYTSVVLSDLEKRTSKIISQANRDASRPLVSSPYVVWFDDRDETLVAYNIRTGKLSAPIGGNDYPNPDMYELVGNHLLWVNDGRRQSIMLTDLSTGETEDLASLREQPLAIGINDEYAMWVTGGGRTSSIILYDLRRGREEEIRRNVDVKGAALGEDYVVWSEYSDSTNSYDLFYYDLYRQRSNSMIRWTDKDQINPQMSRNVVLFENNRLSGKSNTFYYELYDLDEDNFLDEPWSDDAEMEEVRMGGNRVVWIDTRGSKTGVYTGAFASPRDDDDDDNGGTQPDDYTDYDLMKSLTDEDFVDELVKYDISKVYFVFNVGTSKEKTLLFMEGLNDLDLFFKLFEESPADKVVIRAYH